jgi:hypothetical protein
LVPSELVTMLDVIGCELYFGQEALAVCEACTNS